MKYQLSISVELGNNPKETEVVRISNAKLFSDLRRRYPDNSTNPKWFKLHISYEEAKSTGLFDIFRQETQKSPTACYDYTPSVLAKHYLVQVERIAEAHEIDEARWLYLVPPAQSLAEFNAVEADDSYVVTKVTNKKRIAFGYARPVGWMMLFTDGLKDKF